MEMTQELANSLFSYNNGKLYWKIKPCKRVNIGSVAGAYDGKGYITITYNQKKYQVHHIVFLLFNGYLPKVLDHKNCIKDDNRIENLREATIQQNNRNRNICKNNTSGIKNVFFEKWTQKWKVQIRIDGMRKCFGRYEDKELAELVAIEARSKYHGEFANHGNKNEVSP